MEESGSRQAIMNAISRCSLCLIAVKQLRLRLFDSGNPFQCKPPFEIRQELANIQGWVSQGTSIKIDQRQPLWSG